MDPTHCFHGVSVIRSFSPSFIRIISTEHSNTDLYINIRVPQEG